MLKKSFILVIICLLFGALSTQLSAQSESSNFTGDYLTQVWCDGAMLGWAWGTMEVHAVNHYQDGEWVFVNYQAKGEAVCNFSDEKFTYKEKGKEWIKNGTTGYYVLHLKGDQGSKYMMHLSIDFSVPWPWEWTVLRANCN